MSTNQQPQMRKGDIGSVIRVTIKESDIALDISSAAVKQFLFYKPSGVTVTMTASFVATGSDGRLFYTTVTGDLDESGPWQGQVYVEMGASKWHTTMFGFQVGENLN